MSGTTSRIKLNYTRPYLYPKQLAAIFDEHRISVIEASAQPLDTTIQTPDGPRRFGDIKFGDKVFAGDGSVTRVSGVFPKGVQAVYRLTFSGGVQTRASADHLWLVSESQRGERLITTAELAVMAKRSISTKRFPLCGELQYPSREVPIDPWLLGVLIGDGGLCSNVLTISSADEDVVERARLALPKGYELRQGTEYQWIIKSTARGAGYEKRNIRFKAKGYEVSVGTQYIGRRSNLAEAIVLHDWAMVDCYGEVVPEVNLRRELRELGLLGLKHNQKFVPELYMRNSIEVRREVLRGLMDTDGSASRGNGAIIEQTSPRLADNILELIRSLGGMARLAIQEPRLEGWKPSYRINIRHKDASSLFWLPRKAKARPPNRVTPSLSLRSIERIEDAEVACISVAHPSGLYITDDHIVTHNTKSGKTSGCIVWLLEQAFAGKSGHNFWWVAPISRVARIAFTRAMKALDKDLYVANLGDHTITLKNGAIVWFLGADNPDSLFGEDVYAAVIDEASRMKASAFHAIYTTLTATRGRLRIIGNVKGRQNWFHEKARYAQQNKDPEYAYHKIISHDAIQANVLTEDTVEAAKRSLPESVFRELYLAEASDDQGNPFGVDAIRRCIAPMSTAKPEVWGWDLAKSQDWTVGIGIDHEGCVCRFERWQSPWEATCLRITGLTVKVRALVDSTGVGDPIVERLQKVVGSKYEGYKFTAGSKQQLMEGLAVAIQTQAIKFPSGPIVEELEAFEYTYTGHGGSRVMNDEETEFKGHGVRYSAPDGYNDDCVMALALAVHHRSHSVPRLHVTRDLVQKSKLRPMGRSGFNISQMGRW